MLAAFALTTLLLPWQAAAQSLPSYSLSIDVSRATVAQLSAGNGVTVTLTPVNASFIGWDQPDVTQLFRDHPGLFSNSGVPTAAFRNRIVLAGAPSGLSVAEARLLNRLPGPLHGVGSSEFHRSVEIDLSYSGAPLTSDVALRISVDEELLEFVGGGGTLSVTTSTSGDLSSPFTVAGDPASDPLRIVGAPVALTEGGAAGSYTVALRADPGSGTTVVITPKSNDTGAATTSPATLSFTGGDTGTWQTPKTVTVTPQDDDDGAHETLQIDHDISGISSTRGGVVVVTVTDDEPPTASVSPDSLTFYRLSGETQGTYNVRLSMEPDSAVDIVPTVANPSYASVVGPMVGGEVRIRLDSSNWREGEEFQVEVGNLADGEGGTTTITHEATSLDRAFNGLPVPDVTVVAFGGRRPGSTGPIIVSPTSLVLDEDEAGTYTIRFRNDPGDGVTGTIRPSTNVPGVVRGPEELQFSPSELTFTGGSEGTWNVAQTVTVTPFQDSDDDDLSTTIYHPIVGVSDAGLGAEIPVLVNDTQAAGIVFSPSSVSLSELNEPVSYQVSLAARPSQNVSLVVTKTGSNSISFWQGGQVAASVNLSFTSQNWSIAKTIQVVAQGAGTTSAAATLVHTASSSDDNYDLARNLSATFAPSTEPRAVLSVSPAGVSEGGSVTVGVNFVGGNTPTDAKIIPFVYTNGSAESADYSAVASVNVPGGSRTASGTVAITDDALNEGAETFTVSLGTLPAGIRPPRSSETSMVEVTIAASDVPELGIAADASSLDEGETAGFTLTASNASDKDISVSLTVSETGGYVDAADAVTSTVTLTAGDTTLDFDVDTDELSSDNPSGSVTVEIDSASDYTVKSDAGSASQEIIDTDATTVVLSALAGDISETNGSKTVTLTLGRALVDGESLSLPLTIGGSATLATDYSIAEPDPAPAGVTYTTLGTAPTVTFAGGDMPSATSATLIFTATSDAADEGASEGVAVALPTLNANSGTNLAGGASGSGSVSFAITDDDSQPTVSVSGPAGPLDEGDTATFTLNVTGQSATDLTIEFSVSQQGAFVASSETGDDSLTLTAGASSLSHSVTIVSDSDDEPSGSVTLTVKPGTGYAIDADAGAVTVAVVDNDATGVALSAPAGNIGETNGSKTITVTLDRGLVDGEVLALPLTVGGSATLGDDYTLAQPSPLPAGVTYATLGSAPTITFTGPGSGATATSATLILTAAGDDLDEPASETITIDLPALNDKSGTNLDAGASGTGSVSFSITDDDSAPEISLTRVGTGGLTEGGSANFKLTASNPSVDDLTIGFNVTQSGQFIAAADRGAQSLKLTSGDTELDYKIDTVSDLADEVSGSFTIALSSGDGYTVSSTANTRTVTVADDDSTLVTLTVAGAAIPETGGSKTITVTLARALVATESLPVDVKFTGSATFGTDYTVSSPSSAPAGVTYGTPGETTTITFAGGPSSSTSATLTLTATGDSVNEGASESVSVALGTLTASSGTGLDGGARGTGSGSFAITDDDSAAEVSITAGSGVTEGGDAEFTVASTTASATATTVNLSVSATGAFVAAGAVGNNKSVVIPANRTSVSYSVATQSDTTDEVNGSVTVTVASGTDYSVSSTAGTASVAVSDDDPTSVTLAASDTTATEGNATETATLTVTLGRALVDSESLVVPLAVTGVAAAEYSLALTQATGIALAGNTLTFTGGAGAARIATLTFSALADADTTDYANEAVTVRIPSSSSSGTPRMTASGLGGGASGAGSASIIITDAGATPGVTVSDASLTIDEAGKGSYTVVLDTDPGAEVTVSAMSNNTDVTLQPATLTFTGGAEGNWSSPRRITVTAAADGDTTNDSASVTHTVSGYGSITSAAGVSVSVDDAGAGYVVEPNSLRITAGESADYTVRLLSEPSSTVEFTPSSDDTTLATVPAAAVSIAPASWQTGVTVTVTAVAAGSPTISHTVDATVTTDTGYQSPAPESVSVEVLDSTLPELRISAGFSILEWGSISFTVTSDTEAPEGGLTVNIASVQSGDFIAAENLPASATIAEGDTSVIVSVPIENDRTDEPTGRLNLTLQPASNIRLSPRSSNTIRIQDDDPTVVTLSGSGNIAEAAGEQSLTVTLGRSLAPTESLAVPLSFAGDATFGTDYTLAPPVKVPAGISYQNLSTATPSITFTGGEESSATATLRVLATSDALEESDESVTVALGTLNASSGTNLGGGASGSGTASFSIVDDDASLPAISVEAGAAATEGGDATFTIRASSAPAANLTVNINVGQTGNFVASANRGAKTASIAASATTATYTVTTVGDSTDEPDGGVTLTVTAGDDYVVSSSAATAEVVVNDNDRTDVTFSAAAGNIDENLGSKELTVTLGRALVTGESLSVPLDFGGAATFGADYTLAAPATEPAGVDYSDLSSSDPATSPPTIEFTGGGGASAVATLTLTAASDSGEESSEGITIALGTLAPTGLSGGVNGSGSASFSIIDDDDPALPTVSIAGGAGITEGTNALFDVTISPDAPDDIDVSYTVTQTGGDYVASSGLGAGKILGLDAGEHRGDISVRTVPDSNDEPKGSVVVTLSAGEGYVVSESAGSASIEVDDNDPTQVTLSAPAGSIPETGGSKVITVALERALISGEILPVPLTFGGAATFGTDYTLAEPSPRPMGVGYSNLASTSSSTPPTITFTGGTGASATATLILSASSDIADEGVSEAVTVATGTLTSTSGTGLGGGASGSGTASFAITDDDGTPVISITGGDGVTEGGAAAFTVNASPAPQANISVALSVTQTGDFVASGNLGTGKSVAIAAGAGSATYTVATVQDAADEAAGAVTVSLASGSGYTVSTDEGADSANVAVTDNDATTATLSTPDAIATELSSTDKAQIRVTLPRALVDGESLIVPLAFTGATLGTDFTLEAVTATGVAANATTGTVTFTGGASAATAGGFDLVAATDANETDGSVTVSLGTLTATGLDGGAGGARSGAGVITLRDAGAQPAVDVSATTLAITEGAAAGTYNVKLHTDPGSGVTVTVTPVSGDATKATVSDALTFDTDDWSSWKAVSVTPVNDGDIESDDVTITHTVSNYTGVTSAPEVEVSVVDRGRGVTVIPAGLSMDEGVTETYSVVLHSEPSHNVTIAPASGSSTTATVSGAVTFTPATWDQAREIDVTGVNTGSTSVSHTVTSSDAGYSGIPAGSVSVTVAATPRVRASTESIEAVERGADGAYTLQLNTDPGMGATVVVTPATTSSDITLSGALTFTHNDWNRPQTVTVMAEHDPDDEDAAATITHTVSGYGSVTQGPQIAVQVKDAGAGISVNPSVIRVAVGETASYTLEATAEPNDAVNISVQNPRTDLFSASPGVATIEGINSVTAGNETSVDVSVEGKAVGSAVISHSISAALDTRFRNVSIPGVTVIVGAADSVRIDPTTVELVEGGSAVTYDVVLTSNPNAEVVVTPTSLDTGAATVSGAVTFDGDDWQTAKQVTVTPVDDSDRDDETVTITHTVTGYSGVTSVPSVTAKIADKDKLPEISISAPASVTEGAGITLTVNADPAPKTALTVHMSRTAIGDFVASDDLGARTIIIPADATSAAQTVATIGDSDDEASGSLTATLTANAAYTIAAAPNNSAGTGILDNDPTRVTLTVPDGNVDEASGARTLTISLGRALRAPETLPVPLTFSGAATLGTDYTLAAPDPVPAGLTYDLDADPPTVTFAGASPTSATVTLTATQDSDDEDTGETVSIALGTLDANSGTSLDGGAAGSGSGTFIITDDDTDVVPEISVSAGDDIDEGDDASFTVRASPAPAADLDVSLTVSQEGAFVASGDLGAGKEVTINANETSATFTVATISDDVDEVDGSVELTVDDGAGYTVSGTADSDSLDVSDDDATTVTLAVGDAAATEGDPNATAAFSVTLGRALVSNESLTAALTFTGGARGQEFGLSLTAATGIAFTAATNTLTFTGGAGAETVANLTLTALDDTDTEDETVTVNLGTITPSGLSGGATVARTGNGRIVITDAGVQAAVSLAGSPVSVTEGGSAGQYTVVLTTDPGAGQTVVVTPTSLNTSAATVSDALTFTTSDWSEAQAVTVTPVADGNIINETVTVTHAVTGYPGVASAPDATVNVTDRGRGISISPLSVSMPEEASEDYSVVLLSQPENNVTVTPTSASTATATTTGAVTFTPSNWNEPRDISVTGVEAGSTSISHQVTSADTGYAALTPAAVSVSVGAAPRVNVSTQAVPVSERGAAGSYDIVLNTNPGPGNTVQITPSSGDSSAVTVSGTLTFNAQNWSTPQSVTVTPQIDDDAVSESVTLSHTVTGYPGVDQAPDVTVSVTDYGHAILVEPTQISVPVGETQTYSLTMTSAPSSSVNVTPASGAVEIAGVGSAVALDAGDANSAVTIEVTGIDEGTATVTHSVQSSDPDYGGGAVTAAPVTVNVTPAASVRITPVEISLTEGGADGSYSVVLGTDPGGAVVVTPLSGDPGAVTVSDPLNFNSSNWEDAQTITVSPEDDEDSDNESVTITHTVTGYAGVPDAPDVTVAITDDDTRSTVSISAAGAGEEGSDVTFRISASPAPEANLDVSLTIVQQGEFVEAAVLDVVTATIAAGADFANLTIATDNDDFDEPNGALTVTLAENADYDLAPAPDNSASVSIEDNDATSVVLSAPSENISEAGGVAELTLTLGRALVSGELLPVEITFGGIATFGSDYRVSEPAEVPAGISYDNLDSTPTVIFTGGVGVSATATLTLSALQDSEDEGDGESVSIALAALDSTSGTGLGGGAGGSGTGVFTIEDDDLPAQVDVAAVQVEDEDELRVEVTVSLSAVQSEDVMVPVELRLVGGAADEVLASASITIAAGEASATMQVTVPEGSVADGDSIRVSLGALPPALQPGDSASADVTVEVPEVPPIPVNLSAEQIEEVGRVTLQASVSLSEALEEDVSVPVQVSLSDGAQSTVLATASTTITAGGTAGSATIELAEDSVADGDTVTLSLGTLPEGLTAGETASVDLTVSLQALPAQVDVAAVQVEDEDELRVEVTVSLSAVQSEDVMVPVELRLVGGAADEVLASASITIAAGEASATMQVTVPEGSVADGDSIRVSLGALPPALQPGDSASADVTVEVPEVPPIPVNLSAEQIEEVGRVTLQASVSLSEALEEDVSVPVQVSLSDGAQSTVLATASITVAAGGTAGSATIELAEDSVADGDTVTLSLGTLPEGLTAGETASVDLTVSLQALPTQVDVAAVQVEDEDELRVEVTVSLSAVQPEDVMVPVELRLVGGAADEVLASASITIAAGEASATMQVTVPEGSVADGDSIRVSLGALPPALQPGDSASADVTVEVPEVPPIPVNLSAEQIEEVGRVTLQASVSLSEALEEDVSVPVQVSLSDGAQSTVLATASTTITAGGTAGSATIELAEDSVADGDTVTLSLGTLPEGLTAGETASVDLTVSLIPPPPTAAISIADASVREGPGALLEFAVSLSEPSAAVVRVDWETADGSAAAGADYTRAGGTLEIMPGDTSAGITVQVLEDNLDEADETLTVRLSNEQEALLADGEALGTILNLQAPPSPWLGRFGRTVSEQLLEGIGDRVASKRRLPGASGAPAAGSRAGNSGSEAGKVKFAATLGGRRLNQLFGDADQQAGHAADTHTRPLADETPWGQSDSPPAAMSMPGNRDMTLFGPGGAMTGMNGGASDPRQATRDRSDFWRTMLSGSSFDLGGGASGSSRWGVWGRGAYTRFEGSDGGMALDGDVGTGQIGADWSGCNWIVGLSLSHSMGDGEYRQAGGAGGIESSLTAITPYASYGTDRFSVWAALSRGEGDLTLSPVQGAAVETDIEMDMVALGLRGELLTRANGFGLAVLSDVMTVETSSQAVTEMPGAAADTSRIRLALEGSLTHSTASGGLFSARLEGGIRQDKGDLEEGFGGELAGSLGWMQGGLTFEIEGRGLMTHENEDFMQTGASAYLAWDGQPASKLGPSVSLRQNWGIESASGVDRLFGMQDVGDFGLHHRARSLDAEFSWGLPAFGERFAATAYLTHGMRTGGQLQEVGWRLQPLEDNVGNLNLILSATRRESSRLPADHGVGLKLIGRW